MNFSFKQTIVGDEKRAVVWRAFARSRPRPLIVAIHWAFARIAVSGKSAGNSARSMRSHAGLIELSKV